MPGLFFCILVLVGLLFSGRHRLPLCSSPSESRATFWLCAGSCLFCFRISDERSSEERVCSRWSLRLVVRVRIFLLLGVFRLAALLFCLLSVLFSGCLSGLARGLALRNALHEFCLFLGERPATLALGLTLALFHG
jgi:predicted exporter